MRGALKALNAGDPGLHSGQRDEYLPSHSSLFRVVGSLCVLGLSGLGFRGGVGLELHRYKSCDTFRTLNYGSYGICLI